MEVRSAIVARGRMTTGVANLRHGEIGSKAGVPQLARPRANYLRKLTEPLQCSELVVRARGTQGHDLEVVVKVLPQAAAERPAGGAVDAGCPSDRLARLATDKSIPKDADVLVTIDADMDLALLARLGRRLQQMRPR
jgi:hypothetical protein